MLYVQEVLLLHIVSTTAQGRSGGPTKGLNGDNEHQKRQQHLPVGGVGVGGSAGGIYSLWCQHVTAVTIQAVVIFKFGAADGLINLLL